MPVHDCIWRARSIWGTGRWHAGHGDEAEEDEDEAAAAADEDEDEAEDAFGVAAVSAAINGDA